MSQSTTSRKRTGATRKPDATMPNTPAPLDEHSNMDEAYPFLQVLADILTRLNHDQHHPNSESDECAT